MDYLRQVCRFIGVDPSFPFTEPGKVNAYRSSRFALYANYYLPVLRRIVRRVDRWLPPGPQPQASSSTVDRLRESYAKDNERLFTLLGRRIEAWDSECRPARGGVG
jgi:hypothetical protein